MFGYFHCLPHFSSLDALPRSRRGSDFVEIHGKFDRDKTRMEENVLFLKGCKPNAAEMDGRGSNQLIPLIRTSVPSK